MSTVAVAFTSLRLSWARRATLLHRLTHVLLEHIPQMTGIEVFLNEVHVVELTVHIQLLTQSEVLHIEELNVKELLL